MHNYINYTMLMSILLLVIVICSVSPEAVMAMAQSVGVDLNEDDASQLGCIAINKLRHALLVRVFNQFTSCFKVNLRRKYLREVINWNFIISRVTDCNSVLSE